MVIDPIFAANVNLARRHLAAAIDDTGVRKQAQAFTDAAFAILAAGTKGDSYKALMSCRNETVREVITKAAASGLEGFGNDGGLAELAAAYLASIAPGSLLEQIKRYARTLPLQGSGRPLVATGFTANAVAEGAPKVVRQLTAHMGDEAAFKTAAILVMTGDLVRVGGDAIRALFETELRRAVLRADNTAVLDALTDSDTATVASTGDALKDLRAGLAAADAADGYVVGASASIVRQLATCVENRGGMGVRGGTFAAGIEVVALDDFTGLQVIPASRLVMRDYGLSVYSSDQGDVNFAESPTAPSNLVSLFQTGSVGLLAEHPFTLVADGASTVIVRS